MLESLMIYIVDGVRIPKKFHFVREPFTDHKPLEERILQIIPDHHTRRRVQRVLANEPRRIQIAFRRDVLWKEGEKKRDRISTKNILPCKACITTKGLFGREVKNA